MPKRPYYGIGEVPKNRKRATPQESIDANQLRYWGEKKIKRKYLEPYKPYLTPHISEYNEFIKKEIPLIKQDYPDLSPQAVLQLAAAVWRQSHPKISVSHPENSFLKRDIDIADAAALFEDEEASFEETEDELEDIELDEDLNEIYPIVEYGVDNEYGDEMEVGHRKLLKDRINTHISDNFEDVFDFVEATPEEMLEGKIEQLSYKISTDIYKAFANQGRLNLTRERLQKIIKYIIERTIDTFELSLK